MLALPCHSATHAGQTEHDDGDDIVHKDNHDTAPHDNGCDDDDGNGALQPCFLRHKYTKQTEHVATYHPLKSALINIAVICDCNGIYAA